MEKKHLILFEDKVTYDVPFERQGHERVVDELTKLSRQGKIDFSIKVPAQLMYQFFIYYENKEVVGDIFDLFRKNNIFFRYQELM